MEQKPLRSTLAALEQQLHIGQAQAVVSSAQEILKRFPKNLATYRLLGQAYLESRRYSEAAEIFLRLLSSLPDDFTAHLGLALIREYEGNLEAATWHIQRAFECQPASQTMRQEVARLEALRTSQPLGQVQLSRAALGRMYLRGGLYPQAIAEIQAARREQPNHPELSILLAQACEQGGLTEDAVQAAQIALVELPYSLHANRILYTTLANQDSAQAKIAHQRLVELDPYWAYTTPETPDPGQVPDQAVMIEI